MLYIMLRAKAAASVVALSVLLSGCWLDEPDPKPPTTEVQLPAALKVAFGADPNKTDTDGDGLTDTFEILTASELLSPASVDSDGNGIKDPDEDPDSDGLTNIREQAAKTDPLVDDTDGDGLNDGSEIYTYGTNPLIADTDGDGVLDGREVTNGTNPLVKDEATRITSSATETIVDFERNNAPQVVKVTVTGIGDLAAQIRIRPGPDALLLGQVGMRFEIGPEQGPLTFESAEIQLPWDPTELPAADPSKLAIYTVDPQTQIWTALASTVDITTNTIRATTTHFSPFVVANTDTLNQALNSIPRTCDASVRIDAALVIDSSGSMSSNDPANIRITAAKQFVASMKESDRSAVVDFDSSARLLQPLTSDIAALNAAIDTIDASGGTNIGAGVSTGLSALGAAIPDRARIIVLLTDGQGSYDEALTTQMVNEGIRAFTIALSSSADSALLSNIALATGGIFSQVSSADQLPGIFAQYATVFGDDGTDTDGDSLTDCQEIQGFYVKNLGKIVRTNAFEADTDGDGVSDSAEIGAVTKTTGLPNTPYVASGFSDPTKQDTDNDGISDPEEYRLSTNPFRRDSDGDGISDFAELAENDTDARAANSDGDPVADLRERGTPIGAAATRHAIRLALRAQPHAIDVDNDEALDGDVPDYTSDEAKPGFWTGFLSGDAVEVETIPQLSGQIVSGILIFGDSRDALINLFNAKWFDAGIAVLGIVPSVGDEIKAAALASKYIARHPTEAAQVFREVTRIAGPGAAARITGVAVKSGAWVLKPLERGVVLETKLAQDLPGKALLGNFPKIDVFDIDTGLATSIKTIDFDARTYQNISNFERKLGQYAQDLRDIPSDLSGTVRGLPQTVKLELITSRELLIGVPRALGTDYSAAVQRLQQRFPDLSIVVKVVE